MGSSKRARLPRFGEASLARDTGGLVYLEYVVLYAFVGLVVALALVAIGPSVVKHYSQQRQVLYQSSP